MTAAFLTAERRLFPRQMCHVSAAQPCIRPPALQPEGDISSRRQATSSTMQHRLSHHYCIVSIAPIDSHMLINAGANSGFHASMYMQQIETLLIASTAALCCNYCHVQAGLLRGQLLYLDATSLACCAATTNASLDMSPGQTTLYASTVNRNQGSEGNGKAALV